MVHRLLDLCYAAEPVSCQVHSTFHHSEDLSESLELLALCRSQRICFEEGHDTLQKVISLPYVIHIEILSMVVVPAVSVDLPASEVLLNQVEHRNASFALNYRKPGLALPSQGHLPISVYGATEASFSVDEADDPLLDS
jgi:hypothetical protein